MCFSTDYGTSGAVANVRKMKGAPTDPAAAEGRAGEVGKAEASTEEAVTGWGYLTVLLVFVGLSGAAFHTWGDLPWYESLMMGLLVGVLGIVTIYRWSYHVESWNELRDLFRRR